MKKLILSLVILATIALSSFGQTPEGFKYQAVVRTAGNTLVINQAVGMRITIQQGSVGGTVVYQETFAPTTNANGLVNLEIGKGTVVSGIFSTIDWSKGPLFIETAVDMTGGKDYVVMGTSQLMSVPYALHAKTADSVLNGFSGNYNDLTNKPTIPSVPVKVSAFSNDAGYLTSFKEVDSSITNEIQTISLTGTKLSISNANTLDLSGLQSGFSDSDADSTNEIQNLKEVLSKKNDGGALQIKNIADATDAQDAVTKKQIDKIVLTIGDICKLLNLGYTVDDIYKKGNRTAQEFMDARPGRFVSSSCVKISDLVKSGMPINEMLNADISPDSILVNLTDFNPYLVATGQTPLDIFNRGGYSIVTLLKKGITLSQMINAGISKDIILNNYIPALIAAGAKAEDIYSHNLIGINTEAYYTLKFLQEKGYTPAQLLEKVSQNTLWYYSDIPISKIYTITSENIPTFLSTTIDMTVARYISVSDLLNGGVAADVISAANLNTQQKLDLAIQIRLNNGETPLQIYTSDNTLEKSIYGKIYKGGYIISYDKINDKGTVIGKEYLTHAPDIVYLPKPNTKVQLIRMKEDALGQGESYTESLANTSSSNGKDNNGAKFCLDYEHNGYKDWSLFDLQDAIDFNRNYHGLLNTPNGSSYDNLLHCLNIGFAIRAAATSIDLSMFQEPLLTNDKYLTYPVRYW